MLISLLHMIQRVNSLEKTLMLGTIDSRRRRGQQRMRWLDGIIDSVDRNLRCLNSVLTLTHPQKTLESPLHSKEIKPVNPEHSLEGLMLKLQYSDHLMQRADSLEKTLMLGMIEGMGVKGQHRIRWLDGIIDSIDMNLSKLWEIGKQGSLACCSSWGGKESADMTE